jgi:hypothetical protein
MSAFKGGEGEMENLVDLVLEDISEKLNQINTADAERWALFGESLGRRLLSSTIPEIQDICAEGPDGVMDVLSVIFGIGYVSGFLFAVPDVGALSGEQTIVQ